MSMKTFNEDVDVVFERNHMILVTIPSHIPIGEHYVIVRFMFDSDENISMKYYVTRSDYNWEETIKEYLNLCERSFSYMKDCIRFFKVEKTSKFKEEKKYIIEQ